MLLFFGFQSYFSGSNHMQYVAETYIVMLMCKKREKP